MMHASRLLCRAAARASAGEHGSTSDRGSLICAFSSCALSLEASAEARRVIPLCSNISSLSVAARPVVLLCSNMISLSVAVLDGVLVCASTCRSESSSFSADIARGDRVHSVLGPLTGGNDAFLRFSEGAWPVSFEC